MRNLFRATPAEWRALAEAGIATATLSILALAGALFARAAYDRLFPAADPTESLIALCVGISIALFFELLLRLARSKVVEKAAQDADRRSARGLFRCLTRAKLGGLPPAQETVTAFAEHEAFRDARSALVATAIWDAAFALLFVVVVAWLGGWLVVVPLVGGLIVTAVALASLPILRRISRQSSEASAARNRLLAETVLGLEDLKLARAEARLEGQASAASDRVARASAHLRHMGSIAPSVAAVVASATSAGVIALGVPLVHAGAVTMGGLIAASMLAGRVLQPFLGFAAVAQKISRAQSARRTLRPLTEAAAEQGGELDPATVPGEIHLAGVRFAYPGQHRNALDGFDLRVAAGERVALLGPTGAGKTTVGRLLARLYEPGEGGGAILIDGTDIRHWRLGALRRAVGVLTQQPYLVSGSLLENLRLGNPEASADDVERACRIAGVSRWLQAVPEGLSFKISERGSNLSGGQRQSIALARLILADPRIVVLDEPTAHLDPESEIAVVQALAPWLEGRTLILISHRPAPLALCSRAVVIAGGKVAAEKRISIAPPAGNPATPRAAA